LWYERPGDDNGRILDHGTGIVYRSAYKIPQLDDITVLWYFISKSIRNKWSKVLRCTCNEIVRECLFDDEFEYSRLIDSLRRWVNFTVEGCNSWYVDGVYSKSFLNIIEYARIAEDSLVEIGLSKVWLDILWLSKFYAGFDFNFYRHLKSTMSCRLYELLCNLPFGFRWEVELFTIGRLLGILPQNSKKKKYRMKVLAGIADGLNRIKYILTSRHDEKIDISRLFTIGLSFRPSVNNPKVLVFERGLFKKD
jgi:hypothetical protein